MSFHGLMHRTAQLEEVQVNWNRTDEKLHEQKKWVSCEHFKTVSLFFSACDDDDEQVLSHSLQVHFNSNIQHKEKASPNGGRGGGEGLIRPGNGAVIGKA